VPPAVASELPAVADPDILKGEGEDNVSAPSSFIANAHNELYAVYTGKGGCFGKKNYAPMEKGTAAPHRLLLLNPPLTAGEGQRTGDVYCFGRNCMAPPPISGAINRVYS